ncbi:MAG TPA: acetoacetate decarboxylase family protein [Negativicutes bacterium]|nr:acetoacetate decarboxylase family protein [Negativicutes bacterium]
MNKQVRSFLQVCSLLLLLFACVTPVAYADDPPAFRLVPASSLPDESPLKYADSKRVMVTFQTTPEALRLLVPPPLVPNPGSIVMIYAAEWRAAGYQDWEYNDPGGIFLEVALCVPVKFENTVGVYAVTLYLDKASRLPMSREIWGFPKKAADIAFVEKDGKVMSTAGINGTTIVKLSFDRAERVEPVPVLPPSNVFTLKRIPSIRKDAPPDVLQLTSTPTNYMVKQCWRGKAALELNDLPTEPTGSIPVVKIVSANYMILEGAIGYGDVLYDYLLNRR